MLKLVLGGAKSGKSRFAQSLCRGRQKVVFVATASSENDPEMEARLERHREERPDAWRTVEAPVALVAAVQAQPRDAILLIDCATVWLSNLLFERRDLPQKERENRILDDVSSLVSTTREREVIVVSNEVGGGIVPVTPLGREFRDLQGVVNQMLARDAERVWLVVAGIPLELSQ